MIEIIDRFVMVAQHDVDLGQVLEPKPQQRAPVPAEQLDSQSSLPESVVTAA